MELFYNLSGTKRILFTGTSYKVEMFFDGGWDALAYVCTFEYAYAKLTREYD